MIERRLGAAAGLARRLRSGPASRTGRLVMLAASLAAFVTVAVVSWSQLSGEQRDVDGGLLLLAGLVGPPATLLVNAAETWVTARGLGHRLTALASARISIVASAANLLPVPGAALVRIRALVELGSGARQAGAAALAVGLVWLGVAAVAAAVVLTGHEGGMAAGCAVGGSASLACAWWAGSVFGPGRRRAVALGAVAIVEAATVAVTAVRLLVALRAVDVDATLSQATTVGLSEVLAAVIGVVPGGLGLREALAAAFAPSVGLPAASTAVAAVADRLVNGIGSALVLVVVWSLPGRPPPSWARAAPDTPAAKLLTAPPPRP